MRKGRRAARLCSALLTGAWSHVGDFVCHIDNMASPPPHHPVRNPSVRGSAYFHRPTAEFRRAMFAAQLMTQSIPVFFTRRSPVNTSSVFFQCSARTHENVDVHSEAIQVHRYNFSESPPMDALAAALRAACPLIIIARTYVHHLTEWYFRSKFPPYLTF